MSQFGGCVVESHEVIALFKATQDGSFTPKIPAPIFVPSEMREELPKSSLVLEAYACLYNEEGPAIAFRYVRDPSDPHLEIDLQGCSDGDGALSYSHELLFLRNQRLTRNADKREGFFCSGEEAILSTFGFVTEIVVDSANRSKGLSWKHQTATKLLIEPKEFDDHLAGCLNEIFSRHMSDDPEVRRICRQQVSPSAAKVFSEPS
jgi:hypothetical protein